MSTSATERPLTTPEMLMALEEMPPGTGYAALVRTSDGGCSMTLVCRSGDPDISPYYVAIAQADGDECSPFFDFIVGYPDTRLFGEAMRRAPLLRWPRGWIRDEDGTARKLLTLLANVMMETSDERDPADP